MSDSWGEWRDEYGNPDFEYFLGDRYSFTIPSGASRMFLSTSRR
jgi:hypothetical protein